MPFSTTEAMIARAEQAVGRRLPTAWRQRLLESNGGSLETEEEEWQLYPVFDDSDQRRIKRTFNDIVRETAESRKWHGFPADAVAIGSNGTGDLLILLPESVAAFGETLYAWQHDSGELIEVMNAR